MDRSVLRKIGVVAGALVVIGGAVVVLRTPDAGEGAPPPAAQTSVRAFADPIIGVPAKGERPAPPQRLDVRPGAHRLRIGWGQQHIEVPEPTGAAGYEVRWGADRVDHVRLVADPVVQLDGLQPGTNYQVEVRTVDSFGQRSDPVIGRGVPVEHHQDPTDYSFVDRFDSGVVPDPTRWTVTSTGNCGMAAKGIDEDIRRMIVNARCTGGAIAVRSRAPVTLDRTGPELGRFIVETDSPGPSGVLQLDLVPGPVDLVGGPPNTTPRPGRPGTAQVDRLLPPGTIRVRVSGHPASLGRDPAATVVQVLTGAGVPRTGTAVVVAAVPPPQVGVSVRWEAVLRTDGVHVLRDGVLVGGGDVVPRWSSATALVGFTGGANGQRAAVDLIGFTGAPTAPPRLLRSPTVQIARSVSAPSSPLQTTAAGERIAGATGGRLRITLVRQIVTNGVGQPVDFTLDVAGREFPARPAVPGQVMDRDARYPVVVDLPADALVLDPARNALFGVVRVSVPEGLAATQAVSSELEVYGDPSAGTPGPSAPDARTAPRQAQPALAQPQTRLLDASGRQVPFNGRLPRGRLVLEVGMNGPAGQRASGSLAGLAGVEVSLDGKLVAGIPTVEDGAGVGGRWRLAVNTTNLALGVHTVQIKAIGVDADTPFEISDATFVLA